MLSEKQIQQLKAENELLVLQLEDVNDAISRRETELAGLRETAVTAKQLKSKLDLNLFEFEQMQDHIGRQQQEEAGSNERMEEIEKELLQTMKAEQQFALISEKYQSLQADLSDTSNELDEAARLYKRVSELKAKLAACESELELTKLEVESLRDELGEVRALNSMLLKNR
ncbi:MAG: hypothetical protein JWQ27_2483 [Ferruginibacter sp.]|nr:hypothetical protein [Ferruginibacter sp.]